MSTACNVSSTVYCFTSLPNPSYVVNIGTGGASRDAGAKPGLSVSQNPTSIAMSWHSRYSFAPSSCPCPGTCFSSLVLKRSFPVGPAGLYVFPVTPQALAGVLSVWASVVACCWARTRWFPVFPGFPCGILDVRLFHP